ncbi:MAG TPA: choice-of-anchor P family protein, partial [Acidimicrobiia bacterium]|nr:choice-of-anchor P family protein [Acidimicrobiia bacterium]
STCSASPAGTVGNSTLADANVLGIPVAANPSPNTQLAVPGVVTVTLNGQTTTANGLRVRALEVSSNLLASDIVLSESNCGLLLVGAANASRASATTGTGAGTAAMPTLAG